MEGRKNFFDILRRGKRSEEVSRLAMSRRHVTITDALCDGDFGHSHATQAGFGDDNVLFRCLYMVQMNSK